MRTPQQVLTIALALSPLAAAWSQWLPDLDSLVVRQNDGSSTEGNQPTRTPSPQSSATDDKPQETSSPTARATNTDDSSDTSGTMTKTTTKGTSKTTKTSNSKHTTFNALDPAGSVAMIDPPTTAAMPLYRIDNTEPITWKWNYTSLQGKPSAIDVLISCSKATASWTLTQNMTFAPTATFTWDSNKYQQEQIGNQLPVEQYTLLIHDSDGSQTDTPEPGYLAPYAGFQFGLYTAKPYTDLNEWKCATCSAAPGGPLDRQAFGFALSMTLLTVLSFTWYVTGFAALV
ncbi:hypothetical protein SAMD00023353_3701150 [Rosellinia necatrix]|uniref:DUF7137 domain-containing protein n=1 Tax=Rosellinia necatrix TaxID=77044 RepID=A0A1W2TM28_ROSNE|nr:hypothetical protein SAMD00023353_3701150 [Rosellinia necatrix]